MANKRHKPEGIVAILRQVPGLQGVRGRNSHNELLRREHGWEPAYSLEKGMQMPTDGSRRRPLRSCSSKIDAPSPAIRHFSTSMLVPDPRGFLHCNEDSRIGTA
jgi:hypothetical protein